MGVPSFFDAYELRARYFPAVLLAAPLFTAIQITVPSSQESLPGAIEKAGIVLAAIYVISLYVRHSGRQIQHNLWASWNGSPSTRFARWRDATFTRSQKLCLHRSVDAAFGIKLFSSTEEDGDRGKADSVISEAFDRVRGYLRTYDASGLVSKQNAEYGALRNLFGIRRAFVIESGVCLTVCFVLWLPARQPSYLWSAGASCVYLIIGLFVGWRTLPGMVKLAADTYGRNAWSTFMAIANETSRNTSDVRDPSEK